MLTELRITNFAVIEQLSLTIDSGFTVLTGETGTGKSLLIDAVALLVGGRASSDQVRFGEDEAQLEASFEPAGAAASQLDEPDGCGVAAEAMQIPLQRFQNECRRFVLRLADGHCDVRQILRGRDACLEARQLFEGIGVEKVETWVH